MSVPNVLSIAGSDPSGGAGIQADLKTVSALGCYGMAALTVLTAQNTCGVRSAVEVPGRFLKDQIDSIFEDIQVDAVKIGIVGSVENINVIADSIERYQLAHVVLDPVMVATSGDSLITAEVLAVLKERLIPLAHVITPNIPEAERLLRKSVMDMERAAQELLSLGAQAVLLKGGHLKGDRARDVLAYGGKAVALDAPRIQTRNTHGTGCTLSSAVAAYLAKGFSLDEACSSAKAYLGEALRHADMLSVGTGHGPVNHFARIRK